MQLQRHTRFVYTTALFLIRMSALLVRIPTMTGSLAHIYTHPCSFLVKSITSERTRFVIAWYKTHTTFAHLEHEEMSIYVLSISCLRAGMFSKMNRKREKNRPSRDRDLTFPGKWPQRTLHKTSTKQHGQRGTGFTFT
jgi:hypothetical protein